MSIALIVRIDCHRRIPQHGLRTGCGKLQKLRFTGCSVLLSQRILNMPQMSRLLLILHLRIGNGSIADRAPVDNLCPFIDPAFFMHLAEHFGHGLITALIHCKALSVPVTGGTHFFKLFDNPAAVLSSPVPGTLKKLLPAQIMFINPLFFQGLYNFYFRGNAGMVRPRLPERVVALHPLITDQNILHRIIERMSHMELPRDIGGRDHNCERFLCFIRLRMEIFFFQPSCVDPVLNALGIIGLCQLFPCCPAHTVFLLISG